MWSGVICMISDYILKILDIGIKGYVFFGYFGCGIGSGMVFGGIVVYVFLIGDC